MTVQEISDLAFTFVNNDGPLDNMWGYFKSCGGSSEEAEYFAVFVKHWLDNTAGLRWADAYMKMSRDCADDDLLATGGVG